MFYRSCRREVRAYVGLGNQCSIQLSYGNMESNMENRMESLELNRLHCLAAVGSAKLPVVLSSHF